jgi:hypothetical protein
MVDRCPSAQQLRHRPHRSQTQRSCGRFIGGKDCTSGGDKKERKRERERKRGKREMQKEREREVRETWEKGRGPGEWEERGSGTNLQSADGVSPPDWRPKNKTVKREKHSCKIDAELFQERKTIQTAAESDN